MAIPNEASLLHSKRVVLKPSTTGTPHGGRMLEDMGTIPCIDDDRSLSSVRVLVVEDHEPFRRSVCSMLDKRPDLQIVGEVSDGLEAVNKAAKLLPDLILLDVGLPSINGIEAARRIRKLSPESKILFVTQESADEIVQEALNLGAWGYVVKTRVGSDLLAAVESVYQGKHFVSSGLSAHDSTGTSHARTLEGIRCDEVL